MSARFWIIIFAVAVLLGICSTVQAQEQLTLEEAVEIGLDNNYSILIAENLSEIDENNVSLGNAGFLPSISATASQLRSIEDSRTVFSGNSIPDREDENAESTTTSAGAQLEWTVFDGLRMFTSYEQLQELRNLGETESRLTIEQTLAEIISSYYGIVQLKKSYEVIENTVDISRERIDIAETQRDLGSGSEYDLLQARADLSADSAALIRQEATLNNAKRSLNELLARSPDTEFEVVDDIPLKRQLEYASLEQRALNDNLSLAIARITSEVAALEIRQIQGERYPEITFDGGYNYNKNESGSGLMEFSQTEGFSYGLSARVDLFSGFNINRRVENARIELKNQQYLIEEQENSVETALSSAYQDYANALKLVDLEIRSLTNAEQSVDIALERFRLGTINAIELREAQRTLIDAENRLIQAQYEAKTAETELLRLSGQLLENKSN